MAAFDLVIIGAGPGGYVGAVRAAELGMRVACIDKRALGGTCLNIGCIPSKALLESSQLYHQAQKSLEKHGIKTGGVELDLGVMMDRKEGIVAAMTKGIAGLFSQHGVEYFQGTGQVVAPGKVAVHGAAEQGAAEQTLEAKHILLATGSAPIELPGLPFDGQRVISSTEALSLDKVPERLVVVGGGVIGLEMGSVWGRLGAAIEVIEFTDGILPGMDREIADQLQRLLKRQGFGFRLGSGAKAAKVEGDTVQLTVDSKGEESRLACDIVLVAVGRKPYMEGLWGDGVDLETDRRGRLVVDAQYRTNVEGIYAVGDLIPGPMLAHKAEVEGIAAVERLAGRAGQVNYGAIPNVVYTHPEVASVGLSEAEARAAGHEVRIGKSPFRANARAHCMDEIDGLVKIVADAANDRLLGMHILGPQASHLIAEGTVALEFAASAEDVARTVHAHPALSEVVKEAAWQATH